MAIELKDLKTAVDRARPGDIIKIKDGVYNNVQLIISSKGEFKNRIYVLAETPGKVILTGNSTITINGNYTTVANIVLKDGGNKSRVLVMEGEGNRVTGFDVSFTATESEQMFRIAGKKNRIDHCVFRDWNKIGVWVVVWRPNKTEDYAMIDHNLFKNRSSTGASNGLECIRVGTSADSLTSSKTIVAYNIIENCNGEIEAISNKSCDNIYYRNTYTNTEGTLTLRHGDRCIVYDNLFDQNNKKDSGGVRVTGVDHIIAGNCFKDINGNGTTRVGVSLNNGMPNTPLNGYYQIKNTKIRNNVFVNCSNDFAVGVEVKSGNRLLPLTSEITGNIVYKTDNREVFSSASSVLGSLDMKYSNNKIYATNLGKKAPSTVSLLSPNDFDFDEFQKSYKSLYGCIEDVGLQWNRDVSETEIKEDLEVYYNKIKKHILEEIESNINIANDYDNDVNIPVLTPPVVTPPVVTPPVVTPPVVTPPVVTPPVVTPPELTNEVMLSNELTTLKNKFATLQHLVSALSSQMKTVTDTLTKLSKNL